MTATPERDKEVLFRMLKTMLPTDVHEELTELAKSRMTYSGAWDYGVILRELLWAYRVFINLNVRLDSLDVKVQDIDQELMSKDKSVAKNKEENDNPDGLLGKNVGG